MRTRQRRFKTTNPTSPPLSQPPLGPYLMSWRNQDARATSNGPIFDYRISENSITKTEIAVIPKETTQNACKFLRRKMENKKNQRVESEISSFVSKNERKIKWVNGGRRVASSLICFKRREDMFYALESNSFWDETPQNCHFECHVTIITTCTYNKYLLTHAHRHGYICMCILHNYIFLRNCKNCKSFKNLSGKFIWF